MRIFIIYLTLLLAGCQTPVVVKQTFPEKAERLKTGCPESLQKIPLDNTKLSVVVSTVTENYLTYYDCKDKVDAWQTWYDEQKAIFDEAAK